MKVKIIIENGKAIDAELAEEQAKELGLVENKKTGWERAEQNKIYYSLDTCCGVAAYMEYMEGDGIFDLNNNHYEVGNYFTDKSLAERMAKRISLMLRMQRWADENNTEPINWENGDQFKYFICYDHDRQVFRIDSNSIFQSISRVYFLSKGLAEEAIKVFGDEIKEVLGV